MGSEEADCMCVIAFERGITRVSHWYGGVIMSLFNFSRLFVVKSRVHLWYLSVKCVSWYLFVFFLLCHHALHFGCVTLGGRLDRQA